MAVEVRIEKAKWVEVGDVMTTDFIRSNEELDLD